MLIARRRYLERPWRALSVANFFYKASDYTETPQWLDGGVNAHHLNRGSTADGNNANAPTWVSPDRFTLDGNDYFEAAASQVSQHLTTRPFTALVVFQAAGAQAARLMGKQNAPSSTNSGWSIGLTATSGQIAGRVSDGTTLVEVLNDNLTYDTVQWAALRTALSGSTTVLDVVVNGVTATSSPVTLVGGGTGNARPFRIGSHGGGGHYFTGSIFGAAMWWSYLTDEMLQQAATNLST
jgi:hypothetical protein